MPNIELPDGKIVEFPDDMPHDQIVSAIQKKFPFDPRQQKIDRMNDIAGANSPMLEKAANFTDKYFTNFFDSHVAKPLFNAVQGAEQGVVNTIPGLANLGIWGANKISGSNIPKVPELDVAPHNAASTVGNIASFLANPAKIVGKIPDLANLGRSALNTPSLSRISGKIGEAISSNPLISKIAGNAVLGGAYDPDNPGQGILLGGSFPLVGKGVEKGQSIFKSPVVQELISKFSPQQHSQKLMQELGGGAKNLEEISDSIGDDIIKAAEGRKAESGAFFEHPLQQAGDERVYPREDPLISTKLDESKHIIDQVKNLKVGSLFDAYKADSNFRNSHNLQSELGHLVADLRTNPSKTIATEAEINQIEGVRNRLKDHISDFLKRRDDSSNEQLAPMYQKGIDLYRENVAPYLDNTHIRDILNNPNKTQKNIHDIFENPGKTSDTPINKILQDLPEEAKNKILFSKVGGFENAENPKSLVDAFKKAENHGFSKYFNPYLKDNLEQIVKKERNKKYLKWGGGTLGTIAGAGIATDLGRKIF